jgi:CarD family transcriptional regulator
MTKTKKSDFRPNDFVVYPAHGVGKIMSIEEQEIAGLKLELFVISFEKDKMTLRVPTHKATEIGMRQLSTPDVVTKALETLKGKAKVKRAMWSRRAQEYEQKINSGDLMAIAEVVRDLFRTDDQREQSYSERQLYEAALERLTREVAAVSGVDELAPTYPAFNRRPAVMPDPAHRNSAAFDSNCASSWHKYSFFRPRSRNRPQSYSRSRAT